MTRAATILNPRTRPKTSPPIDNGVAVALLPAIAAIREAKTSAAALVLADSEIPSHLIAQALGVIIERGQGFHPEVIHTLCKVVGFATLEREVGYPKAMSLWRRYVQPHELRPEQ